MVACLQTSSLASPLMQPDLTLDQCAAAALALNEHQPSPNAEALGSSTDNVSSGPYVSTFQPVLVA